jgi:hypothetical protein
MQSPFYTSHLYTTVMSHDYVETLFLCYPDNYDGHQLFWQYDKYFAEHASSTVIVPYFFQQHLPRFVPNSKGWIPTIG